MSKSAKIPKPNSNRRQFKCHRLTIIIGLGEAENHRARVRRDCDSKSGNEMVRTPIIATEIGFWGSGRVPPPKLTAAVAVGRSRNVTRMLEASRAFKAKVALEVQKGQETLAQLAAQVRGPSRVDSRLEEGSSGRHLPRLRQRQET